MPPKKKEGKKQLPNFKNKPKPGSSVIRLTDLDDWLLLMTIVEKEIIDSKTEEKRKTKLEKIYSLAKKSFKNQKPFNGHFYKYFYRDINIYEYREILKIRIENNDFFKLGNFDKYKHLITKRFSEEWYSIFF